MDMLAAKLRANVQMSNANDWILLEKQGWKAKIVCISWILCRVQDAMLVEEVVGGTGEWLAVLVVASSGWAWG